MRIFTLALLLLATPLYASSKTTGEYDITVTTPEKVPAGGKATYSVTIVPKGEWKLKTETPFKVKLAGTEGVAIESSTLRSKDFADPKAASKTVSTHVTAPKGKHTIDADLMFFLCSAEICKRHTDKVAHQFEAK
jgi:hypothetical protein